MWNEFKAFAMRGSVLDMAVGIIMGVAFGRIVTSLVNDVIMPPIGIVLGRVSFSDLFINLSHGRYASLADAKKAGAATINYGAFINTIVEFLIVAFAVFLFIEWLSRILPKKAAPATTKECTYCRSSISIGAVRCPHCTSQLEAA